MRIKAIIIAIIFLFSTLTVYSLEQNPDTSDWFSWDMPDDNLAKGTAIDASFMLDAPAGKYGFVRANGENIEFVDENGNVRPARFWGTNIGCAAIFGSYDDLDKLADRIARVGYNLVRFHAIDAYFNDNNVFGVINGATSTASLDAAQLDKMFYLIARLKNRGVYIYMDLMAYRPILADDNISPTGKSFMQTEACFSDDLIELQKQYARQLLTTVNPYTGLALKDDPVMVFLQLHNENALTELTVGYYRNESLYSKSYYANQLKQKFNTWLKNKYGTTASLTAAWFQLGKTGVMSGERLEDNSVNFDYAYQSNTSYSTERKKDSNRFVYDTLGDMYTTMVTYLKGELGVKCLITGSSLGLGAKNGATASACDEFTDFIDNHEYNSHPTDWFSDGSLFQGFGSSAGYGWNVFWRLGHFRTEKPHIIGEYNECLPNPYGAETEMMMATIASFQNWHPLNYCLRVDDRKTVSLYDAFQSYNSPVRTAVQPSAAILFHRKDVAEATISMDIPITRDNIINNNYPDGKIQSALFSDYAKVRYKLFDTVQEYNSYNKNQYNAVKNALQQRVNAKDTYVNENIVWDRPNTLMKVTTDYTNMITGETQNLVYESGDSKIEIQNEISTISLVSLSEKTLKDTNRMLLTTAARERNTDMVMSETEIGLMISRGKAPVIIEPVSARVTIKTNDSVLVYALDSSGQRKMTVPVSKTAQGYSFFETNETYQTMFYEIIKIDGISLFSEMDSQNGLAKIYGYDGRMTQGKSVTLMVFKPGFSDAGELTESNAEGMLYYVFQTVTDSNGYFCFNVEMANDAERGEYTALIALEGVEIPQEDRTFTFVYDKERIYPPDASAKPAGRYLDYSKSGGCSIIDIYGNVAYGVNFVNVEQGANKSITHGKTGDPAGIYDGAYKISYSNTAYPLEFNTNTYNISPVTKNYAYLQFDLYRIAGMQGNMFLRLRDGENQFSIDISDYIGAAGSWQTVRIPLYLFSDNVDFDWSKGTYYIGIGFTQRATGDIYVKNMYVGTGFYETADYYYNGGNTINVVENGNIADGMYAIPYSSIGNYPSITKNVVVDGLNSLKVSLKAEGNAAVFGHNTSFRYADVTSTKDYLVKMRVKLGNAEKNTVSLVKTTGQFTGAVTFIGRVGPYFKPTQDWQTVIIPLSEFSGHNLSSTYGIGLGIASAGSGNTLNILDMYINEITIIHKDSVRYNEKPSERVMRDDYILYRHGAFSSSYSLYPSDAGNPNAINESYGAGGDSNGVIRLYCYGRAGIAFDISEMGINDNNYHNKYIKFDVMNVNTVYYSLSVGRSSGTTANSIRDVCNVGYGPSWQTVIVPLSAITNKADLSWEDTKNLFIQFNDTVLYKYYYLDNITIGTYVDGEITEGEARIVIDNSKAYASCEITNTMNSHYAYSQDGKNILAVRENGILKKVAVQDGMAADISPGSSIVLTTQEGVPVTNENEQITLYRWESLSNIKPIGNTILGNDPASP